MASQRREELASMSSQSSHNAELGNPVDIAIRANSMPESLSTDDGQTKPLVPPPPPGVVLTGPEPSHFPRQSTYNGSQRRLTELDWILPVEPKREARPKTLQERLLPTVETARAERVKYELKAKLTGYALNIAIGLQVLLGSLTTGLSVVTTGRQTSIMTTILGGLSTVVASYLARSRGSNEPELSIIRCKDLEQFIRECEIFMLDFGHISGNEHDEKLTALRDRYEELLGNGNGERRLASV
ncbi:hypothetical protein C8R44DRAFT_21858 [Mycena epipterygia]|nr:hypothetical protein C8R44DRAFT_21858 [Mycena epipterygia]